MGGGPGLALPGPQQAAPAPVERSPSPPAPAALSGGTAASSQTDGATPRGPPDAEPPELAAPLVGKRPALEAEPVPQGAWDGEPLPKRPRHSDDGAEQPPGSAPRLRLPPGFRAHLARVYRAAEGMAAGVKAGLEAGLVEDGVEGGPSGAVSEQGMRAVLAAGLRRVDPCAGEGDCLEVARALPAARAGLLHAALRRAVKLERQAAEQQQAAAAGGEGQEGQQEQLRARALRLRVQVADVMCEGELSAGQ
jgi:hypothetical protein